MACSVGAVSSDVAVSVPSKEEGASSFAVRWENFDLEEQIVKCHPCGTGINMRLRGTALSCPIETTEGSWEHRKRFLENTLHDVVSTCPKEEPLVVISLGSDYLLMEYILGRVLIENGFVNVSFCLVDPTYCFSPPKELSAVKVMLTDFRAQIEGVFSTVYQMPLGREKIRFCVTAQDVCRNFVHGSNVVVLKCIPPYTDILVKRHQYRVEEKTLKELILGGHVVPSGFANTMVIIPCADVARYKQSGENLTRDIPFAIVKTPSGNFSLDWGCKIYTDGTYRVSFSGQEGFLHSLPFFRKEKIRLHTGVEVKLDEWIPVTETAVRASLDKKIKKIKEGTERDLTPVEITALLEKVQKVVEKYMPGINNFFLYANYEVAAADTLRFLSRNAGHHYRRTFTFASDVERGCVMTIEEIIPKQN